MTFLAEDDLWAVVMAGSARLRDWPVDQNGLPAAMQHIDGVPTSFDQVMEIANTLVSDDRLVVACTSFHLIGLARRYARIPEENFVAEPLPRGSGPVLALTAELIAKKHPEAIVMHWPADYVPNDFDSFSLAVHQAVHAAREGWIVCIGCAREYATDLGYILRSDRKIKLPVPGKIYQVQRFLNADDLPDTIDQVDDERLYGNSGVFLWRTDRFAVDLDRFRPDLHALAKRLAAKWLDYDFQRSYFFQWSPLTTSSIEGDVLQRADKIVVAPSV